MNIEKGFLLALIAVLASITAFMLRPFLGFLLAAVMLAFILYPVQRRIEPYLGSQLSAALLVAIAIILTSVPLVFTAGAVLDDARELSEGVNDTQVWDMSQLEGAIQDYTGQEIDIMESVESTLRRLTTITVGGVSQFVTTLLHITLGIFLTIFLLYYFLKDGPGFIEWIKEVTPLPSHLQDQLYDEMNQTTWAVIKGHVLVAIIQGLVAGAGLFITGVPNYAFWTFVMIILAFIPIIGTFLVWGPASVYLFMLGRPSAGLFLILYGFLVVSLIDNFLRPIVVDRGADLHPAVILAGVLGGVYLFGAAGLFIGPILLGIFKSATVVFKDHYQEL